MQLKIGDKAPSFTLYNTEKNEVSLSDYKDKTLVILFFPLAFTGVCTTELCSIRDNLAYYSNLNTEVLGISIDSIFSLGHFKEQQNINFPLLSDFNKTTAEAYGCLYEEFVLGMKGVAKRSAFVVDGEGIIQYAEVLENAGDLQDFDAIKETVSRLNN